MTSKIRLGSAVTVVEFLDRIIPGMDGELSRNLQRVLTTIVTHAVDLSGTDGGAIYEFDEAAQEFQLRATHGMSAELIETIRRVAHGLRCVRYANVTTMKVQDSVGERVRDRLTPKEMQIVALIVQGCKNKDIAQQLNTKEQVVKNYLRNIYDKTGVSTRAGATLFAMEHRLL